MMEEELNKIKISFMNSYKKRAYFSALESIYEFAEIIDKEKYIDYMEKRFDWKKYFIRRKWQFKKYGYFVYGNPIRQIFFQFIRGNSCITKAIFRSVRDMPEEFFTEWEKYEENSWLSQMIPRACEVFDNICFYKEFGNRLNSEESIRSYGCILMGYISMDLEYFCLANRQKITNYFPRDIFKEQPTGAVIDGGGYDGDTAAEFFMMYPKYKGGLLSG